MAQNLGRWRCTDEVGGKAVRVSAPTSKRSPASHVHVHVHDARDAPLARGTGGLAGHDQYMRIRGPGQRAATDAPQPQASPIGRWVRAPAWHNHSSALVDYQKRLDEFYSKTGARP